MHTPKMNVKEAEGTSPRFGKRQANLRADRRS
ncbi:MAG: hypothetical protein QOI02_330 [Actinomycetota bacterium]|jgi:hypothetical protein|nr:hypothetical protein [Actinomycetota bacterium]